MPRSQGATTAPPLSDAVVLPLPALVAAGLRKSFPGVRAVRGVDLTLRAGEVHGLVGENGAGKSTLVKMLTGAIVPDAGTIEVAGVPLRAATPAAALAAGVAAIHQEPNIVTALSPVANVFLGQPMSRAGCLRERAMRRRFREWNETLGLDLPADGRAGDLSVGARQGLEIIRALERDARVVAMDEPTASLSIQERSGLFRIIDVLRARGTAVVFISHKLEDVLALCDTVTVMRDGEKVLSTASRDANVDRLVGAMLGASLQSVLAGATSERRGSAGSDGTEVLKVRGLTVPGRISDVDLVVRRGEIVGVAGLVGSGRSTLLRALGGAEPSASADVWIEGREVALPRSPRRAMQLGVALAPEDRRTQGLVLSLSAGDNVVLPSLRSLSTRGFARRRRLHGVAAIEAEHVGFSPGRMRTRAGNLSGGNQQKLVLGKLLLTMPKILLIDEPGRGVDIGAKGEIFRLLLRLAESGVAIVMVSEEIDELLALVDRVVVMRAGEVSAQLDARTADGSAVLGHMFSAGEPYPAPSGGDRCA